MMDTEKSDSMKRLYSKPELPLLRFPSGKHNKFNDKQRNIQNLQTMSSAQVIAMTGITPERPMIFCGKYQKSIPVILQLLKMTDRPFLLIGNRRDIHENSVFSLLESKADHVSLDQTLPETNSVLILNSDGDSYLLLKDYLTRVTLHIPIVCVGNGLALDYDILHLLNSIGQYILLSESLYRSIKHTDTCSMAVTELLSCMDYIIISSIGAAGKELLKVVPEYDIEKTTNTVDLSLQKDSPDTFLFKRHHKGHALRLSQSSTLELKPILTQKDLLDLQATNTMLIYNTRANHIAIAKISK